jgi:hypothetical protein
LGNQSRGSPAGGSPARTPFILEVAMDTTSVIQGASRRTDGKKVGTWEVVMPDGLRCSVDFHMLRKGSGDGTDYEFYLNLDPQKHHMNGRLAADTPGELAEMLDAAVDKDIRKNWKKMLKVECDSYHNDRQSPEDPGDHELSVRWQVVWCKGVGKKMVWVKDGDKFPMDLSYTSRPEDISFIPWTQQREDVLRGLGKAIQEAHAKLEEMIRGGKMVSALDSAASGMRMLMQAGEGK